MKKSFTLAAAAAISALAAPAAAQVQQTPQDILGSILGTLFGNRVGAGSTLDAQWSAGQTPLANQQTAFESRVDAEVRTGNLTQAAAARLKNDYYNLVVLEQRYAADGRFTAAERSDLTNRYGALTQVLAQGGYANSPLAATAELAAGQAEFNQRVDAAYSTRRITRTQATRLKSDYAALVQLESNYLRDGVISAAERADLDARMDALDARVGDVAYTGVNLSPRARLDAISRALPTSGLGRAAQAQLLVEHGDLTRLADAYARINATAEEQAYLDRRLGELEARARLR
jgi:hypothetical protein